MNAYFNDAFRETLGLEGGYANDPYDPGGETKWGISKRAYPDLDIADLSIEDSKSIYYRDYWQKIRLDEVKSGKIAGEIFDTAVNMGRRASVRIVQAALNFLGEDLVEDGSIGLKTLTALNKWCLKDERALFVCLNGFQFMGYVQIVENKPDKIRFSRGWTKRIQQYRER